MAFPVIQAADSQHGVVTTNSTTWTLTYPTNLASGDLILVLLASDGQGATSTDSPAGFNVWSAGTGAAVSFIVAAKVSDGTETGNFTFSADASEQGAWRTLRITGWYGGSLPASSQNIGIRQDADGFSINSYVFSTGTSSANPNPPALNPGNWDVEDTLWVVLAAVDTSRTFSAWPTSYSPGDNTWDDVSGGSNGASLSVQWRNNATASEDPGTFTISAADDWMAITVAVRPAAAVALVLEHGFVNFNDPGIL